MLFYIFTSYCEEKCSDQGTISPEKLSAATCPQNVPAAYGSCSELNSLKPPTPPRQHTSNTTGNKLNEQEETQSEVSVLDLLSDDGPKGNSEGRSVPEVHVAFSVEGLGKVGIGTPAHSPWQHKRCYPSPPKASRRIYSSTNLKRSPYDLELELNSMMNDIRVAQDGSPSESIWNTRGLVNDDLDDMESTMFTFSCMSPEIYKKKTENTCDYNEDSFYDETRLQKKWQPNSTFGILDENFFEEGYDAEWKNKPLHTDCYLSPTCKSEKCEKYDLGFGDPFLKKNRTLFNEQNRPDFSAPFAPHFSHFIPEKEHSFMSSDRERYRASNCDSIFDPPPWSFFTSEDSPDSMSLLSEESCSSAAVREERNYEIGSCSGKWKQNMLKHKDYHQLNSREKFNLEKFSADENYLGLDKALQEKNLRAGNYRSMLHQWSSKAEALVPRTCHRSPMEADIRSFSRKLMTEDNLFDLSQKPNLCSAANLTHKTSKFEVSVNHEFPNSFIYENDMVRQLSDPDVQLQKPATSQLVKKGCFPPASWAGDFKEDSQCPGSLKQQDDELGKTLGKSQESVEKYSSSSGNRRTALVEECKKNCSDNGDLKREKQVSCSLPTCDPPVEAGESPIAVEEVPSQLESCIDDKLNQIDDQAPVPSQVSNKDNVKKFGPQSKNVRKDGGSEKDASYQVMLESYVLQLLCVQKVLLDASGKDIGKMG